MKKYIPMILFAALLTACGGGSDNAPANPVSNNEAADNSQIGGEAASPASTDATATPAPAPATAEAAPGKDGKALIEGSDCRTCHKDDAKLIGPSYQEVAAKYENTEANVKMLAEKVTKGGQGVWGEIPMAGHPNLSHEDAEAMVKYILAMRK